MMTKLINRPQYLNQVIQSKDGFWKNFPTE